MKPLLLFTPDKDGVSQGYLVDEDSACPRMEDGRTRIHYFAAVDLRSCMAGQVELTTPDENGSMRIVAPMPIVLSLRKRMKPIGLEARGLNLEAAVVMLKLSASAQNVQASFSGSMTWTFGEPIKRTKDSEVMANATPAKLIAAWKWSHWQRHGVSGAQQHADMQQIGYRGDIGAFYEMMEAIGLSVTKAR